jgi:2-amino-4-hydroxy-6-hydroxymethyldihydropteridine diphosphokinase
MPQSSLDTTEHTAYLGLGSNLGDREGTLREAIRHLDSLSATHVLTVSSVIETPPWGYINQPAFLNMAVQITTSLTPEVLLAALQKIETTLGRVRSEKWGPRTLDIDILVYADEERNSATLSIPHPWLTNRRFVLLPLAEIAPDLYVKGKKIIDWLAELS